MRPSPRTPRLPIPWCGTTSSRVDRLPDATSAYAVHVAYVRPASAPDRFLEFAPRIVGDAAAFDAWWRGQDPTRTPRFDLFPAPGCASSFGALDISNVQLSRGVSSIGSAFQEIRRVMAEIGFNEAEKAYLVYYDGPTGQVGLDHVCGQGARSSGFDLPGLAVVYLDSCDADQGDSLRPVVAMHELVHVFGAVERAAPNVCQSGHVCDFPLDLMTAVLTGEELEAHVLDSGRNDYYGHSGSWTDVQDSTLPRAARLARPHAAGRSGRPPCRRRPHRLRARLVAALDGRRRPGRLPDLRGRAVRARGDDHDGETGRHARPRALRDSRRGRSRPPERARRARGSGRGPGMVDEQGRLIRDTVRPPAITRVTIKRTAKVAVLSWPAAHDAGGLRAYRVKIGPRTLTVQKPTITLARARVSGPVSIAAIDRAGNIGPSLVVARGRVH